MFLTVKKILIAVLPALMWGIDGTAQLRDTYWRGIVADTTQAAGQRLQFVDSLLAMPGCDSLDLLDTKGTILYEQLRYAEAARVYSEMWCRRDEMTERRRVETGRMVFRSLSNAGQFSGAVRQAIEFIRMEKPDELRVYDADAYALMAFSKIEFGMGDNALRELARADSVMRVWGPRAAEADVRVMEMVLLRTRASFLTVERRFEEALKTVEQAMEIAPDRLTRDNLTSYIGDIYMYAGENGIAERYYRKVLESPYSYRNRGVTVCNFMDMLVREGRSGEALDIFEDNIGRIPTDQRDVLYTNLLTKRGYALAGTGRWQQAYETIKEAKLTRDSLNEAFLADDQLALYDLELVNQERGEAIARARGLSRWLMAVIGVLAGAVGVCAWALLRLRRERRVSREASGRLDAVEAQHRQEVEKKDERISVQGRELTVTTLQLAQIQELMADLLSITDNRDVSAVQRLREIQSRIRQTDMQGNMWEMFKAYFEQTNPDFFKILYERHPELSPGEVRMCAYLMLGLTNKEIAGLTNRSYRTVESIKYRLHKKLGLDTEPTSAYLRRLR